MNFLRRALKFAVFPAFYLSALFLFSYFTFPWEKLKDRLVAEYQLRQKAAPGKPQPRLEIGSLRPYYFTGVELRDVKLIYPPDNTAPRGDSKDPPKETVVAIDRATARLRLLPLLLFRARLGLRVEAFGGTIEGVVPVGTTSGAVDLHVENVDISQVGLVEREIGLPLGGTLSGDVNITPVEGSFAKAAGTVSLAVAELVAGDGKTKIKGQILLPPAHAGTLELVATAEAGILKIEKFVATGPHVELVGDGKISVREPPGESVLDLLVRFKFTDAYRSSSDAAKGLLGAPGQSSPPPLIELQEPRMKRAKRADGFYGWRVTGQIKGMKFEPSTAESAVAAPKATGKSKPDSPFTPPASKKRPVKKRDDGTDSERPGDVPTDQPPSREPGQGPIAPPPPVVFDQPPPDPEPPPAEPAPPPAPGE